MLKQKRENRIVTALSAGPVTAGRDRITHPEGWRRGLRDLRREKSLSAICGGYRSRKLRLQQTSSSASVRPSAALVTHRALVRQLVRIGLGGIVNRDSPAGNRRERSQPIVLATPVSD